jgi:FkbM family methyltransferase
LNGLRVSIRPADTGNLVIYEEVFISRAYDLSQLRFEPTLVIDGGAYEGYFTLLAKGRFPNAKYLVFEPQPENYAALLTNLSLNSLNIDARKTALSTLAGELPFSGTSMGGRLGYDTGAKEIIQVQVTDICEVIGECNASSLLLKLDVEGEEASILPALIPILPTKCAIFFEWHHGEQRFCETEKLLRHAGFDVVRCRTWQPNNHGIAFVDAFAQRQQAAGIGGSRH